MNSSASEKTLANARGPECALLSGDHKGAVMLTLSLRQATRIRKPGMTRRFPYVS
jgi:hypothetical protein